MSQGTDHIAEQPPPGLPEPSYAPAVPPGFPEQILTVTARILDIAADIPANERIVTSAVTVATEAVCARVPGFLRDNSEACARALLPTATGPCGEYAVQLRDLAAGS
ncbi:hypothetical protein ACIGMX_34685 [Streptomyces aquilus]|uniref:hypothetical protein n=1 Tax=Streptomyces aquilus TaxID=2548456 RepID=UPI0037D4CC91